MRLRRQLPVYSPLSASALLSGAGALLSGGGSARRRVTEWLEREYRTTRPLLTGSGTMALALAMRASRSADRPGVALPAYGCYDLVTAALGAGVPVAWYDLDPATLAPDWPSLERALSGGVGGMVIVHYYGVPVDFTPVRELARRFDTLVIEDAAQGIGGALDGLPLGALGDLGVLSFGRGKGLTGGGGGALLLNTERGRSAHSALGGAPGPAEGALRALATTTAQWLLARPSTYALPSALPFLRLGETVFREPEPERVINPVAVGILAETMHLAAGEADSRRRNAAWLIEHLRGAGKVPGGSIGQPGYLRLPMLLGEASRLAADSSRARALGIMAGYPMALNSLPGSTASSTEYSGARELVQSLVTLPVHSKLKDRERKDVVSTLTGSTLPT